MLGITFENIRNSSPVTTIVRHPWPMSKSVMCLWNLAIAERENIWTELFLMNKYFFKESAKHDIFSHIFPFRTVLNEAERAIPSPVKSYHNERPDPQGCRFIYFWVGTRPPPNPDFAPPPNDALPQPNLYTSWSAPPMQNLFFFGGGVGLLCAD